MKTWDTALLAYSQATPAANILDLTNPKFARKWGYEGGIITEHTKTLGSRAQKAGFDVIRVKSERGPGNNLVVLTNFDRLLTPKMIVPAPLLDPSLLTEELSFLALLKG